MRSTASLASGSFIKYSMDADGTLVGLCVQVGDPGGVDSYFGPAQALPFGAGVSPTGGEQ